MTQTQLQHQQQQQQQQQQLKPQHPKAPALFACVNCGHAIGELQKKYSNGSVKAIHCDKCHKVADKYIEFESVIILVDAMLLSQEAYRHMLHNRDFKLHWKLSLVLLLLESFALWRKKRTDNALLAQTEMISEKGFYICCLQNIFDYLILTALLLLVTFVHRAQLLRWTGVRKFLLTLLKAMAIANFSKFFLLPIMVWRGNTTDLGANIHHLLVLGHHLFSLMFIYAVVGRLSKLQAGFIVLPAYFLKEYLKMNVSAYIEEYF